MKRYNTIPTENTTTVWLTPKSLLADLGHFDLDPCACSEPRPWDIADVNYTKEDDGLTKQWAGRVWLNPPYGSEATPFLKKMSDEKHKGLSLLFARTDTKAFRQYILESACCMFFIYGRLKFHYPSGEQSKAAANAASVLIAWDKSELPLLQQLEKKGLGKLAMLQ